MTDRDFRQVERELDEVMSKLKGALDPKFRRDLLREMRRLLAEAEQLAHVTSEGRFPPTLATIRTGNRLSLTTDSCC